MPVTMKAKKEKPMFNDQKAKFRDASREYDGLWFHDKVLLSYIMLGYKVCVHGAG